MYAAGKAIQSVPPRLPDVLRRKGAPNPEPFDSAWAAEYNFSPVAQVTLDQHGVIVRLNLAAANLLKGERSQLLRLPFLAFVEKSCCRAFLDHFASCMQFRRRVSSEIVLANYTRSGARVELQSTPGIDQSGKVICRMAIITKSESDRSARELATKVLSGNQRADAELFELSPDAVIVHVGGKIATATAGAARLLGAGSVSDLLGKDLFQFIHPNYHGLVRERLLRLHKSEKELPIAKETFVRLDGSSVTVNVASCAAMYRGNPATVILARELAKHQELEENLHSVEDLSAQILANNSIATAIISLPKERFVNANEVFCNLCGLRLDEITGCSLAQVGWRLITDDQKDLLLQLGTQGSIQNREARMLKSDGGYVDVIASAKPTLLAGEQCVLLMVQDLTDLQRLKHDVVSISEEELRRFGRDLHDSHCQDLTAIAFFAQTIADTLESRDPEITGQVCVLVDMIRRSAENVHALAAGLGSSQVERTGLANALKELASRTSQRFGLTCIARVDRKCRFRDTALAVHLYRIAQEATSNAAKHSRAKKIEIKIRLEGDTGALEIEDDGEGFVFDKTEPGLGLRTMDYRAAVIKGRLKIDSKPGAGTVVTCLFSARQ